MSDCQVSIITPSYNSSRTIAECIDSVISQTYLDWEMLIVDDASTDNSQEIINDYVARDPRVKLITLATNSGAAVARNTAIEAANGRYMAFLDADDLWLPKKLEKQIAVMQEKQEPFSFTAYRKLRDGITGNPISIPKSVTYKELLKGNRIGCLTAVYDTAYFGKCYMPRIRKRQDYGLWLQLLKKVPHAIGINESLALYRIAQVDTVSSNKVGAAAAQWFVYRKIENLPLLKSIYYFSHYAMRGGKKFLR